MQKIKINGEDYKALDYSPGLEPGYFNILLSGAHIFLEDEEVIIQSKEKTIICIIINVSAINDLTRHLKTELLIKEIQ